MTWPFTHTLVSSEHSFIYQMVSFMARAFCDLFMKSVIILIKALLFFTFRSTVTWNWFFYHGKKWRSSCCFFPMWISNWSSITYYKRRPFPHRTAVSPLSYIKLLYMNGSAAEVYSVPLVYFSFLCQYHSDVILLLGI